MTQPKKWYITTTLPYVNADPHIGFALEIVHADIVARAKALQGYDVFFNTGTDEHGQKIAEKAGEQGEDPQVYVDRYAEKFKTLRETLDLSYTHFIRTTNAHHKAAAQEFWKRCDAAGDIYKKQYKVKYCVGCELEKTDSELVDGRCPLHPTKELEVREEENYFFRFSKYQDALLKLYAERPDFIVPASRANEIIAFVERGLEDFSISRLKEKMSWGVPVPGDDAHVMYVWFDALINYISTTGWPEKADFDGFWPGVQIAGKDNLRQQSAMWQAMLMSAELPPSSTIWIHGFITSGGQKMSKSLGNVVDPLSLVNEYSADALRYFLARHIHPFEDSDFTIERFKEAYNANLANGLGNLVSRIMKLAETHLTEAPALPPHAIPPTYFDALNSFRVNEAADMVWAHIQALDERIQSEQPFKVVKTDPEKGKAMIQELVVALHTTAEMLAPFMPETSRKVQVLVQANTMPEAPLFLRKD
jgi:methionyl-tRNA synthetase